ncbi:hypothetical protein [Methylocapsa aurea]|uniref:hypothetical protein n=1 Tax=Methylocapsa aurea TaxID=663610 RepID=UPI003D18E9EC
MTSSHPCVEKIRHENVTVKQRGRRANFVNPERAFYNRIQVDGCLVSEGKKADWIVSKINIGSVIVELKGKHLDEAYEQLLATIENKVCSCWLEERRSFLIICSRVPSFDTIVARKELEARKRGVRLKIICGHRDIKIESLLGLPENKGRKEKSKKK